MMTHTPAVIAADMDPESHAHYHEEQERYHMTGLLPVAMREVRVKQGRRYVRQPHYYADPQRWAQAGIFTSYSPGAPMEVGDTFTIMPPSTAFAILDGIAVPYVGRWRVTAFDRSNAVVEREAA